MNKYLVPICDVEVGSIWIQKISAKSFSDCEERLMSHLIETCDYDFTGSYKEFVEWLDYDKNILVGEIQDIEEL